jgi:uncharacterized protein YjbI with pentapeptide repeats
MADQKHLEILKQGAEVWNEWREEEFYTRPQLRDVDFREIDLAQISLWQADLSGANFSGKDLSGQDLMDTDLTGATFKGANLRKTRFVSANFYLADLAEADLFGADLQAADFRHANLRNVDLRESYLGGTNFSGANLHHSKFDRSLFNATTLGNNDLSATTGLESVNHNGPSIIGIDTLYRSNGRIPTIFLRGCGVSEQFIASVPSLIATQQSQMFDSCFISYSHKDEEFGKHLVSKMREANIRVWFASDDAVGGKKTIEQVQQQIENHDRLLVVLSHDSLNSEWVKTEIGIAAKLEKLQGRKKLFPVRLIEMNAIDAWSCFDADMGKDLAKEVREYPIRNFATWNQDANVFEAEFEKLVLALRKESDNERNR